MVFLFMDGVTKFSFTKHSPFVVAAFFQCFEPHGTVLSSFHLAMGYFFRSRYCPAGLISDRNFDPCCQPSLLLGDAAGGLGT